MKTIADLHNDLVNSLSDLARAMDAVLVAADAAAAVAEEDPEMAGYLESILPLMDMSAPLLPQSPEV